MATINLLDGSLQGKLGKLVGQKYRGKAVIRSNVDKITHQGDKSTLAVRAFEKLCRFSGGTAKYLAQNAVVRDDKLLPHNALARWLKSWVTGGVYDPTRLDAVRPHPWLAIRTANIAMSKTGNATVSFIIPNSQQPLSDVILTAVWSGVDGEVVYVDSRNGGFGLSYFDFLGSGRPPALFHIFAQARLRQKVLFGVLGGGLYMGIDYSQGAQLTGDIWVDGNPIFVQCFNLGKIAGGQQVDLPFAVPPGSVFIDYKLCIQSPAGSLRSAIDWSPALNFPRATVLINKGTVSLRGINTTWTAEQVYLLLYYTIP